MGKYFYDRKSNTYFKFEETDCLENPRDFAGYDSTFITFERNYYSPDKNPFENWEEMMKHFKTEFTGNRKKDLESLQVNALKHGFVLMPVWKYEHSGRSYAATDSNPFPDDYWNEDKLAILVWEYFNDVDVPIYVGEFESLNDVKLTEDKIEALYKEKEEVKAEPLSVTVSLAQQRCGNQNTDSISKKTIEYNR